MRVIPFSPGGTQRPTVPPPPSGGPPGPPHSFAHYRKHFFAFFDPRINPYIGRNYRGADFDRDFQRYMRAALGRSGVLPHTYRERANLILGSNPEVILGYLESLVKMTLDETDVKALNILFHDSQFIFRAGHAIYKERDNYGMKVAEDDAVREEVGRAEQESRWSSDERIEAHLKICAYCSQRSEAIGKLLSQYGDGYSARVKTNLAAFRKRPAWYIKQMLEKFKRFELAEPLLIETIMTFIEEEFAEGFRVDNLQELIDTIETRG